MSATLTPSTFSPENPITDKCVVEALEGIGELPEDQVPEYAAFLKGVWEIWNKIDGMEDYVPSVDTVRFPRKNVHRPEGEENPANAWAWKVTITGEKEGLLAGKTVCLKDTVAVKDVPCLLGTDYIKDWTPNTDATIVTRILEAGGTILGKAVCENMSLWGASGSSATGLIHNVHGDGYSAGGSSSGTGVLVARGDVDLGIGGDQGGSIRIPASKNGIVGMKPTTGLVPYTGIAGLEATLDHVGPMTRTVLDNALFLQVLAGVDGIDDRQQAGCPLPKDVPAYAELAKTGVKGLKIGLLAEAFDTPMMDKRVAEMVRAAAEKLTSLGATVDTVSVPMHSVAPDLWATIGRLSSATQWIGHSCGRRQLYLNDLTEKAAQGKFDDLHPSGINTLVNGLWAWKNMPPTLLGKATNLVRKLRDDYYTALDEFDALIMPTLPFVAPKLVDRTESTTKQMASCAGVTLNTSAFNLTGMPALSLPVGRLPTCDENKVRLPVGMQVVGKFYSEDVLYRVGYAWESHFEWMEC